MLKKEYEAAIKAAAKQVCKVYFYQCPETRKYFSTRKAGSRYSPEGQAITRQRFIEYRREYRKQEHVKQAERERMRNEKEKRNELARKYYHKRQELDKARRERKPKACRVYFLICQETGKLFTAKTPVAKYSKEGLLLFNRRDQREKYRLKYSEQHHQKRKQEFVPKLAYCKACGKGYMTSFKPEHRNYCSVGCRDVANQINKAMNKSYSSRARKYGVRYGPISVVKVFNRDKWTCQICGIKTPKANRGTIKDNAPELDHIIPLSKGGSHTVGNVQCACRKCNNSKRDRLIGQMQLFA